MNAIKKTISISADIVKEATTLNANFSSVVEAALTEYLQNYHLNKAIESFGQWEDRAESSVDIVNELRRADNRERTLKRTAARKAGLKKSVQRKKG